MQNAENVVKEFDSDFDKTLCFEEFVRIIEPAV